MGRLFDAAASLIGVRQTVNYEAQAAIEMESQADPRKSGRYSFQIQDDIVDPAPIITGLVEDWRTGQAIPTMAARFHNTIAAMVCRVAIEIRAATDINQVVLSGGVWQNMLLLSKSKQLLGCEDFEVYRPSPSSSERRRYRTWTGFDRRLPASRKCRECIARRICV